MPENEDEEILFPELGDEATSSLTLEDDNNTPDPKDSLKQELETFTLEEESEENSEDTDDNTSLEGNNSSPSVVSSLALALRERGVMTTIDEEKINSYKEVDELIEDLIKDREESTKAELSDKQRQYLEALREGVPEEEIKQDLVADEAYNSLADSDLEENIQMQRQIVYNDLVSNNIAPEKAKKIIANAENTGTLLDDSKESLVALQEKSKVALQEKTEKARAERESTIKTEKEKVSKLKDDILKIDDFAGIKLNETQKQKAFETLTKVIAMDGKTPLNTISADRKKDPIDFDKRQALIYTLTDGFTNFKNLETKVTTSKLNELKDKLAKGEGKMGIAHKPPLSTSANDFLDSLRKETIK